MKCIIIAAGYATRLYPLTENFPKPLLEVNGKTILDHLLDEISEPVDEYFVVTNHRFYEHFLKWSEKRKEKIEVIDDMTSSNETRLGAVRDIELAARKTDDDCLVMAGDNLLDFSLDGFIRFAKMKDASCVMCHEEDRLEALRKTAVISVDEDRRIMSYEEKPQEPKGHLAVPPFYFYKKADLARISEALEEGCKADAPGSFAAWLSSKTTMYAYLMPGKRYDIGDLKSYEYVKEVFAKKTSWKK